MAIDIVFWQNFPSIPHQSALLRALSFQPEVRVRLVCDHDIPDARIDLGWGSGDFGQVDTEILPTRGWRMRIDDLLRENKTAVHIFSGFVGYWKIRYAMVCCISRGYEFGIMAESVRWYGDRRRLRSIAYRAILPLLGRRARFLLAIGCLAETYYATHGFPHKKIYPFAYFTPTVQGRSTRTNRESKKTAIYIGQLIPRKGVETIIRSVAMLSNDLREQLDVVIVGDGPERARLETLTKELGADNSVEFRGARPYTVTRDILSSSDVLILPSLWDGWGSVVNEAIQTGIPVVVSNWCGAADLIRASGAGAVIDPSDPHQLAETLKKILNDPSYYENLSDRAEELAPRLDGVLGAQYILEVIEHSRNSREKERPVPAWLNSLGTDEQ